MVLGPVTVAEFISQIYCACPYAPPGLAVNVTNAPEQIERFDVAIETQEALPTPVTVKKLPLEVPQLLDGVTLNTAVLPTAKAIEALILLVPKPEVILAPEEAVHR